MNNFSKLEPFNLSNQRVWLYQFEKQIRQETLKEIQTELDEFTKNWSSHGDALKAKSIIFADHFILVAVNESSFQASGCSIDKCTQLLKSINDKHQLDLFNRLKIAIYKNDKVTFYSKHEVMQHLSNGLLSLEDFFVDISIAQGIDLSQVLKPIHQSWFYKPLSHA